MAPIRLLTFSIKKPYFDEKDGYFSFLTFFRHNFLLFYKTR